VNLTLWRLRAAALIAAGAAGTLVVLPSPRTPTRPTPAGPASLAQVWPDARTIDVPAALPDGRTFEPSLVLDEHTVVGMTTDAAGNATSLVALSTADATYPRALQAFDATDGGSVDAVTEAAGQIYWMAGTTDTTGNRHTTLRRADRAGGVVRTLTTNTGEPAYYGSQYDLQVAGGGVYWTATGPGDPPTTELRTISIDGGPVTVRPLDGTYQLTAWPWLTSLILPEQPTILLNASTGQRDIITPKPGEQLTCGPTWCRAVTFGSHSDSLVVTLRRRDDSAATRVNADGEDAITVDIAVLDRFELLSAPLAVQQASTSQKLSIYDLKTDQHIPIAVTTGLGTHGSWLWWSTGDNETRTWHLLNLATLR
jgi:hypothetical protein